MGTVTDNTVGHVIAVLSFANFRERLEAKFEAAPRAHILRSSHTHEPAPGPRIETKPITRECPMTQRKAVLCQITMRMGITSAALSVAALAGQAQMAFSPPVNVSNNGGNS
jgi:hypothetical protein